MENNRVITGKVRFSYLHVWEPDAMNDEEPKYKASILIDKTDTATLDKVKRAIEAVKAASAVKWGGSIPKKLDICLRDGDVEKEGDEAYAGKMFINAKSKTQPGLVNEKVEPILDRSELYSGCYGRAGITLYAFNSGGNKGIAAALDNLQKLEDGEPLGGVKPKAEDDFGVAYNNLM